MTGNRTLLLVAIGLLAACGSIAAVADDPPKPIATDDDEERKFQLHESRRLIEENCQICHSVELIEHQRLTPKQWSAEVDKMIGWGAPLPPAESPRIAAYLAEKFPKDAPPPTVESRNIAADLRPIPPSKSTGDPKLGAPLFATGCANCHGPDARGAELGPNLVEKTALLDGKSFVEVVLKGRRRMPASETVLNPSQVDDILAWLRSLR